MSTEPPSSQFALDHSSAVQTERGKKRRGSRNKLAQRFFEETYSAWEEQGEIALRRAAFHDPMGFCNMIARLMPQKVEHSIPTDGLSDDRLAELIELGERMVALRQSASSVPAMIDVTPSNSVHEKLPFGLAAKEGAGGPARFDVAAGGGSTSTIRDAAADEQPEDPNKLKDVTQNLHDGPYDDRTPVTPYSSSHAIPHPIGRPFAKPDHEVERANKAALSQSDEEPIDPASLF